MLQFLRRSALIGVLSSCTLGLGCSSSTTPETTSEPPQVDKFATSATSANINSRADAQTYVLRCRGKVLEPGGLRKGTHIYASGSDITDADLHIFNYIDDLTDLSLGDNPLTGSGLKDLACPRLEALLLFDTLVDDAGLKSLPPLPALKRLFLKNSKITGDSLEHIATYKTLDTLDLSGTAITGESLAALKELTKLYDIDVSRTELDRKGLENLATVPALAIFNLSATKIAGDDLAALANKADLFNVTANQTQIDDRSVEALAAGSAQESLKVLKLRGTKITSQCVPALRRFKKLFTLDVRDTALTENDLDTLRSSFERLSLNQPDPLNE